MKESQASTTALFAAFMRANHTTPIFDDYLAHYWFTPEENEKMGQQLALDLKLYDPERAKSLDQETALAEVLRLYAGEVAIYSRARYTEDNLEAAVKQGIQQYVILGAGMDTFAFRHKEMLMQLQIFEIDHPATQTFKCRRIAELGWEVPSQLHFVPVNFELESLAEVLTRSAYNPKALTFFSWVGVSYYLTRDTVFTTLRSITDIAPKGSMIIFDYLHTDAFIPQRTSKRFRQGMELLRQIGEPNITGFDPSRLAADLSDVGLHLYENLSPADIEERYFQGHANGQHAADHVHFAWAIVE